VTEHLRVSGLYWGLTALTILGREDALPREEVIAFLLQCFHPSGRTSWFLHVRAGTWLTGLHATATGLYSQAASAGM